MFIRKRLMDDNFRREQRLKIIISRGLIINDVQENQGSSYQISETILHCSLKKCHYDISTLKSVILQVERYLIAMDRFVKVCLNDLYRAINKKRATNNRGANHEGNERLLYHNTRMAIAKFFMKYHKKLHLFHLILMSNRERIEYNIFFNLSKQHTESFI